MRLDWGGLLDGKRAFRVVGTAMVYETVKLENVSGALLRVQDGGVLEIEGILFDLGDNTAVIKGATYDLDEACDPVIGS